MNGLTCAELRPLLGGYVLEGLEPEEAEAVRAHLADCPDCAAELASLAELPALLDLAAPVAQPTAPLAPGIEEALLDRVARESDAPRPRKRRRLPRLGIAWTRPRVALVSAVLAASVAVGAMSLLDRGEDQQRMMRNYVVALKAGPAHPTARARISLYRVKGGTGVHLWASGLQPGSTKVYEMLCGNEHWSTSAGTFRADARGRVEVKLTTAARVGEYDRVRVVTKDRDGQVSDVLTGRLF
jgi:Putative zinc-finger/Anti-sigma-K factor rskA